MRPQYSPGGPNPSGLCGCGCGRYTRPAPDGTARRFLRGHAGHQRIRERGAWGPRLWTVEERGYETPCFIWIGCKDRKGYGVTAWHRRPWKAYARAWVEAGRELRKGFELDHLCREPACVNPDHLELVTHTENVRRGAGTKLNVAQVVEIRSRSTGAYGEQSAFAREFGVRPGTIRMILNGETWKEAAA